MTKTAGLAPSTIHRVCKAFGPHPHRGDPLKLWSDPLSKRRVTSYREQMERPCPSIPMKRAEIIAPALKTRVQSSVSR